MPVRQDLTICLWLDLFKRLVYVLGQFALSQILTVLLDLARHERRNHSTITQRTFRFTMVNYSPECKLTHGQAMLSCSGTDDAQRFKIALMPVLLLVVAK